MIDAIEDLLPQTQCGKCKHPGCRPYAEGIAAGEAINHCVPGGQATINALADLLGEIPLQLNPDYGVTPAQRQVAFIREEECIGCTKCINACPVDAIIGSAKLMHSVIDHECTGCGLCVDPCPVDCIEMVNLSSIEYDKDLARERYKAKQVRLLRDEHEKQQLYREKSKLISSSEDKVAKQQYILQALERAKAKRKV